MAGQELFSDTQKHWSKACIHQLTQRNLISGYPNGTFRPNASVTRAEFAALLTKVFSEIQPVREAIGFKDVSARHWAYSAIQFATRAGFLSGYPDATFRPNLLIPRVQVVVALAMGLKCATPATPLSILQQYFDDFTEVPNYAHSTVAAAIVANFVVNYPAVRRFRPNQNATRGEVAAFLCQVLTLPWQMSALPQYVVGNSISHGGQARLGDVTAEVKNGRLKISRKGQALPDLPLFNARTGTFSESMGVRIVDLDRDGEPELLIDGFHQETECFISQIYFYQPASQRYAMVEQNWGNLSYQLRENGPGSIILISGQKSFNQFSTNSLDSAFPIEIWRYEKGQLLNVTLSYPDLIRERANQLWQDALNRQRRQLEAQASFAAYLAEQYLLNKKREGWYLVRQSYQGRDAQGFFTKLVDALALNNYITVDFLIEPKFDELETFTEGLAPVRVDRHWSYVDYSGNLLSQPQFLGVEKFAFGKALVRVENRYGCLDKRGNFTIAPAFDAVGQGFSEGLLAVEILGKWGYSNEAGTIIIPPQFDGAHTFSEGLALVWMRDKYGYIDLTGNLIIPLRFDGGGSFSEGLARVWVGEKVGYIDPIGNVVIQPIFDYGDTFQGGITRISLGNLWGYINRSGNLLPTPAPSTLPQRPEFDYADAVNGERMRVRKGEKWGYCDATGKLIIDIKWDGAGPFQEGMAGVKLGTQWGYIDQTGKVIIPPQFERIEAFSEGIAVVKLNRKYGYINKAGKLIASPQFDAAYTFTQGFARVRVGNQFGYIDQTGTLKIPPQFDQADNFTEGLARVKLNQQWGYIHTTGTFVISPQFEGAGVFHQGLARVRTAGKWGYIKHPLNI